jgi:hypothetical protein
VTSTAMTRNSSLWTDGRTGLLPYSAAAASRKAMSMMNAPAIQNSSVGIMEIMGYAYP